MPRPLHGMHYTDPCAASATEPASARGAEIALARSAVLLFALEPAEAAC
jgi:hypothetical protein